MSPDSCKQMYKSLAAHLVVSYSQNLDSPSQEHVSLRGVLIPMEEFLMAMAPQHQSSPINMSSDINFQHIQASF